MLRSSLLIWEFSVDNLPVLALKIGLRGGGFWGGNAASPIRPSPAASGKVDRQIASRRCGEEKGVRSPALNSACVALGWAWFWGFGLALRLFFICPAQLPAKWIGKLLPADAMGRARSPGVGFGVRGFGLGMRRGAQAGRHGWPISLHPITKI